MQYDSTIIDFDETSKTWNHKDHKIMVKLYANYIFDSHGNCIDNRTNTKYETWNSDDDNSSVDEISDDENFEILTNWKKCSICQKQNNDKCYVISRWFMDDVHYYTIYHSCGSDQEVLNINCDEDEESKIVYEFINNICNEDFEGNCMYAWQSKVVNFVH